MKKKFKVTTNLFTLVINFNASVVSVQITIFFGLFLLALFAKNVLIHKFCVVVLILDAIAFLYSLLAGASIEEVTETDTKETQTVKEDLDVTVNRSDGKKKEAKAQRKGENKEEVIRNKVGVPNPTPTKQQEVADPVVSTVTESVPNTVESVTSDTVEQTPNPVSEMTDEDWAELFQL